MVDLFRYMVHDFVVPAATAAIDVANQSDFQQKLADTHDPRDDDSAGQVRALAEAFLTDNFASPTDDPTALRQPLASMPGDLRALSPVTVAGVRRVVRDAFGKTATQVVKSAQFAADRELLQNAVLAVKLVTGFDQVDSARLVRQLQAAAFLEAMVGGGEDDLTRASIDRLLGRPVRIPPALLAATKVRRPSPEPPDGGQDDTERILAQREERDRLQAAYDALLAVQPRDLELAGAHGRGDRPGEPQRESRDHDAPEFSANQVAGPTPVLRLAPAALETFLGNHRDTVESLRLDLAETPLEAVVDTVGRRLSAVNAEVLPLEVATTAKVFRVGGHLFAETTPMVTLKGNAPLAAPAQMPDFSAAVTRPVGIGNLQVVRQELIGYRPTDISHIENVLEGELLHHNTRRIEVSESIVTDETFTAQSEERDHQSTDRNELSSETQKESGKQSSSSGEGMTASDYGRLVENSKTNFAQTVVAKSVESLTQQVRRQRVQRESKTFVEQSRHRLDNSAGKKKIRGIYQWVDKLYSLRVLNYGKRLTYDVVVPEPAAFLVQALKNAVQPETFHLTKPLDPNLAPSQLNASNYTWYAAQYGVTGAVSPAPQIFAKTFSHTESIRATEHIKSYGVEMDPAYQTTFKIVVPEGYQAVSGYIQHVNVSYLGDAPGASIEVIVGAGPRRRLMSAEHPFIAISFTMAGETGEVPVTLRSFPRITSLAYAVALVCQRTDSAYEQWQLKTHATIVSGYQRQLADYEDRLSRYVAAVRTQLAQAGNYAHDPTTTLEELKRAFIFLLLGEHPAAWLPTPVPAPVPPWVTLPDPEAVKKWGAVVAFFERAFEWENLMYTCYPYYWGRPQRWEEMLLTQDADPRFEAFLKAGAARVVVPVRPGFEAALAHYQETGDVWMGEEIPDMFSDHYLSIIDEIKAANAAPGDEVCVEQWEVTLPTTLVLLKENETLPTWTPTPCNPEP